MLRMTHYYYYYYYYNIIMKTLVLYDDARNDDYDHDKLHR